MNKLIRKKHNPYFSISSLMFVFNFYELEKVLGHSINHKIKRSLTNRRMRKYRKEKRNTCVIGDVGNITNLFDNVWYGRGIYSTNILIGTEGNINE
jgi:hypothetical protein